jgi:hypothetical protein
MFNRILPHHLESVDQHNLWNYRGACYIRIRKTLKCYNECARFLCGHGGNGGPMTTEGIAEVSARFNRVVAGWDSNPARVDLVSIPSFSSPAEPANEICGEKIA